MLDYANGKHELTFDTQQFGFQELMLKHLTDFSIAEGGPEIASLEQIHQIPGISENVEKYRQAAFSLFRMPRFQTVYRAFGAKLIDDHFGGTGLIQKTPTVRIQLPDANSTSYHSDGWYGHGASVRSFWMPLVPVRKGNTLYMASDISRSQEKLGEILESRANLSQINEIAREVCVPFEGKFGDMLSFSAAMLHGAEKNVLGYSRVSFDFRIAGDPNDLGSKPTSNFYSREELAGSFEGAPVASATGESLSGITYSNLCKGKSAKSQLMLCVAYAESNSINIIGNESEIVALDYMPVLRNYLLEENDQTNCVVVFGVDIFEGNKELAIDILECAEKGGRSIVFCAEGIVYRKGSGKRDKVLSLV